MRRWRPQLAESLTRAWREGIDASVTWLGVTALTCLVALITCDLLLIVADIFQRNGLLHDPRFDVTRERGYGEMLQYLKFVAAGAVLSWRFARTRSAAACVLGLLFFYLFADDAFSVHERAGDMAASRFQFDSFGPLRPADVGELAYLAAIGSVAVLTLGALYWRGRADNRRMILTIGAGLAMLAVPAIGVHLLHSAVQSQRLDVLLGILEDGGEMIAASSLAAAAVLFAPARRPAPVGRVEMDSTEPTRSIRHV